jgi:hypothetical protein
VFSYEIDGSMLILRASGTTTLSERQLVLNGVRDDAAVPSDALLLLDVREVDVREVDVAMSEYTGVERLRVLLDQLGRKLGPFCAVIAPQDLLNNRAYFRMPGVGSAYESAFSATSHQRASGSVPTDKSPSQP